MTKKNHDQKNQVETLPVSQETKSVAMTTQKGTVLPSLSGASPEVLERIAEVADNLESVENFRIPRAKMTAGGIELIEGMPPVLELEGVILHTRKTNVYYDKPFNPSIKPEPPRCYSLDGVLPEIQDGIKPIHPTCKGCPMAEFGTNSMKSGKACRNLKPMYLLLSDDAIIPRQLTVTPSGLKAANQYLLDLTEQSIAYRKVKTRITLFKENPRDTFYKLKFSKGTMLKPEQVSDVEFLKGWWMTRMNAQIVDNNETSVDNTSSRPVQAHQGEF